MKNLSFFYAGGETGKTFNPERIDCNGQCDGTAYYDCSGECITAGKTFY